MVVDIPLAVTLVVWQDVTGRAGAELALRESEEKYRALIETNVDFVWETDAEGRYTYCSPQMERLWDIRPEEMIGRTPFDMMPPGERALAAFAEMASAPSGFSGLETVSYDGRGNAIAIETSGVPFFGDDGALLGYRGITRDVTERVRAGGACAGGGGGPCAGARSGCGWRRRAPRSGSGTGTRRRTW